MLTIITGKAGTGKTRRIMNEIKCLADSHVENTILIVPEQYSHEAERELSSICGDSLSLYAEVMSFTALARKMMSRYGGLAVPYLDKGGKLLCMALAMKDVGTRLESFRSAAGRTDFQDRVLGMIDELKASCITSDALDRASESCGEELGAKLRDISVILSAYDSVVSNGHADPADRISVLAKLIEESDLGENTHIFIDGFMDFTGAEHRVISALLKKGVRLTICLNLDSADGKNEIFSLSRSTLLRLKKAAEETGTECTITEEAGSRETKPSQIGLLADNLLNYSSATYEDEGKIQLYRAGNINEECEFAAAKILELVREEKCRWRDISVAVRGFEDYRPVMERVFRQYGVPLFISRKSALGAKPLPLLIRYAYEITSNGWEPDDILSYIGTGLTGLDSEDGDLLGSYVFRWQLREKSWKSRERWNQHPEGYGAQYDDSTEEALNRINSARKLISTPLLHFAKRNESASTAEELALSVAELLEELKLSEQLSAGADRLRADNRRTEAEEYLQLWNIIVSGIEQISAVLGDTPMSRDEFSKLFLLMLSKYDIGTIPVSLDRVSAGDMDRMRRRNLKYLLILGADDSRIPGTGAENSLFTYEELEKLHSLEVAPGGNPENEIWREFLLAYNCVSLPSEKLIISYPAVEKSGEEPGKSIIVKKAEKLFKIECRAVERSEIRLSAQKPAFELALNPSEKNHAAARRYFEQRYGDEMARLEQLATAGRGSLSKESVEGLYGQNMRISASRADNFFSCRYMYFCNYGLKAKPYETAEFAAAETGRYMHYVLQHVAEDAKQLGGFKKLPDDAIRQLVEKYIELYIKEELRGLEEKSERFKYLISRMKKDMLAVSLDMAEELRRSDFEPLAFEMDFGRSGLFKPVQLNGSGDAIAISGIADRVDGWTDGDRTYLRIVDYKTGIKRFSLTDIWYGMSMQMLLYLYALDKGGENTAKALGLPEGTEILPAGAEYFPARNKLISGSYDESEEEIKKARKKELKRSGIVTDAPGVLSAWEKGEEKIYCPAGEKTTVSRKGIELLYSHVVKRLGEMAAQLRDGDIAANPYKKGETGSCDFCPYMESCHFADGENGEELRAIESIKDEKVWEKIREELSGNE